MHGGVSLEGSLKKVSGLCVLSSQGGKEFKGACSAGPFQPEKPLVLFLCTRRTRILACPITAWNGAEEWEDLYTQG